MVLRGVLEDFLDGAGRTGGVDDTALGDGKEDIFPHAVLEILGDAGSERRGRFVAVEPGGDAQAVVRILAGILGPHLEGRAEPAFFPEGGRHGEDVQGIVQLFQGIAGHPGTQMRGFHGARAAAGAHQVAPFREVLAKDGHVPVRRIRTFGGVSAHHRHHLFLVVAGQEIAHGVPYGVIVHRTPQGVHNVAGFFAAADIIGVNLGVVAGLEGVVIGGIIALIEAFSVVQLAAEAIVNQVQAREHDAAGAQRVVDIAGQLAPQEDAVAEETAGGGIIRALGEVDVLEDAVAHMAQFVRGRKVVHMLDFAVGLKSHHIG